MASKRAWSVPARASLRARRAALTGVLAVTLIFVPAMSAPGVQVTGRGQLSGSGSGTARLEGSGTFYVRGCGTLTVLDPVGDADVEIRGFAYSKQLSCGFRIYRGSGWVRVSASHVMVKLDGDIDEISACGGGTCYLRGDGRYRVRSRTRLWKQGGVYVRFDLTG